MKFFRWWTGQPFRSWQEQIKSLEGIKPMSLPPVKKLQAQAKYPLPAWASGQVLRFRKRSR